MKYIEILTQIRQIVRSVNLESKRIEKEYGISIPQLLCLTYLVRKENHLATHKDIKDFLKLNASTVTGIISRLEKKGFISRLPRQKDKRVSFVNITQNGQNLLKEMPELPHLQLSEKLKQLSPDHIQKLQDSFDVILNFLNFEQIEEAPILPN
ncbi:MAG: DNA-binding MarR family transcriptional regulator [Saprospiraceae bacterium]|jgi:DNA-binding MarR family transcriptional regulator